MHIAFVTSSLPVGPGQSNREHVVVGLAKAMQLLGHDVTVVAPLFRTVDTAALALARRLSKITVRTAGEQQVEVYDGRTSSGLRLSFLGNAEHFEPYAFMDEDGTPEQVVRRASVFAEAAAELIAKQETPVSVVHAVGWPGGLAGAAVRFLHGEAGTPVVFSLTASGEEQEPTGAFPAVLSELLPCDPELRAQAQLTRGGAAAEAPQFFATRLAALAADAATVVGPVPSTVDEILEGTTPSLPLLRVRPGIDWSSWNPATDPALSTRFDPTDLSGKQRCKAAYQRSLKLPVQEQTPLLAIALTQGTLERVLAVAPRILVSDLQLVVFALGDDPPPSTRSKASFEGLAAQFPDRFAWVDPNDDETHQLLAAADLIQLPDDLPSLTMKALRYGAVPIAAEGLGQDALLIDCDPALQSGNGFLFDPAGGEADLLGTLRRAVSAFFQPNFSTLQSRVMRIDHSWEHAARWFEQLYRARSAAGRGGESLPLSVSAQH